MLKYYELICTVYLKENIHFVGVGEFIGKHINYTMTKDEKLKELHSEHNIKMYCFDYLFPREYDKTYKKGSVYVFKIRTPKEELAKKFRRVITQYESIYMKCLGCQLKIINLGTFDEIYTVTPALATFGKRYWTVENDFEELQDRIINNLSKKYKFITGENLNADSNDIQFIDIKNKVPIKQRYKESSLICNKFKITFAKNENGRKLAYSALSCGLLEKSSALGLGFVISK